MTARFPRIAAPSLSIRTLVVVWAGSVFLAWAILVLGWLVVRVRLTGFADRTELNGRVLNTVRGLESAILDERRADLLWRASGESRYRERRDDQRILTGRIVDRLGPYATSPEERECLDQIREKLQELLVESPAATPLVAVTEAADELLMAVSRFREEKTTQMEELMEASNGLHTAISYWMLGLSIGAAALLLLGAHGIIHRVVHPVLSLTGAADIFGRGDFTARAPILHDDELGSLARTFNNMATDIANRESNRMQFVATVAHDLKNPVLAMEMAGRILQDSAPTEEQRPYIEAIVEEAKRLRSTLRDLMDDLQVASGYLSIRRSEVEISSLIRNLVQTQAKSFVDHEVIVDAQECVVLGDARRIERVAMNLLTNAAKYSPRHTQITVRVKKTESFALISVSDRGPGISKEDMQVIFQPFGRGRSADVMAEGSGMGLYIVKQIVEAHGGQIEVHSEPGQGATFLVKLPLAQAHP